MILEISQIATWEPWRQAVSIIYEGVVYSTSGGLSAPVQLSLTVVVQGLARKIDHIDVPNKEMPLQGGEILASISVKLVLEEHQGCCCGW